MGDKSHGLRDGSAEFKGGMLDLVIQFSQLPLICSLNSMFRGRFARDSSIDTSTQPHSSSSVMHNIWYIA